jgi:hypothetical protein
MDQAAHSEFAAFANGSDRRPSRGEDRLYLQNAEACLAAAARTHDLGARRLHEEECRLWIMLARQREAIEAVVQTCAA